MPDELRMEAGYSPDTVALLEKAGYKVKRTTAEGRPYTQGEVAAIRFSNGWLEGAPDPRTEATAEGH
jgi:gamma-glutamyltranspeptidase